MNRNALVLALCAAMIFGMFARELVMGHARADTGIDRAQVDRIVRMLEKQADAQQKQADAQQKQAQALRDLVRATERCR